MLRGFVMTSDRACLETSEGFASATVPRFNGGLALGMRAGSHARAFRSAAVDKALPQPYLSRGPAALKLRCNLNRFWPSEPNWLYFPLLGHTFLSGPVPRSAREEDGPFFDGCNAEP